MPALLLRFLPYLLGFIAVAGIVGTAIYKVKKWGGDEVRLEWNEAIATQREEEIQRSLAAAAALQKEREHRREINKEITVYVDRHIKEFVESPTCFKPVGVSCLNGIIAGKGSTGCESGTGMSAAKPPS